MIIFIVGLDMTVLLRFQATDPFQFDANFKLDAHFNIYVYSNHDDSQNANLLKFSRATKLLPSTNLSIIAASETAQQAPQ